MRPPPAHRAVKPDADPLSQVARHIVTAIGMTAALWVHGYVGPTIEAIRENGSSTNSKPITASRGVTHT